MTTQTMRLSLIVDGQTREAQIEVRQVEQALARLKGQAETTGAAMAGAMDRAGRGAAGAAQLSTQNLASMQFQLQDMAVGLASGQSPFTVIMQQGSQVAQMFQPGTGLGAAMRAFGSGLVAFVSNPLNLAVAGIGILASVGVQAFAGMADSGKDVEDSLERQDELIRRITASYGEAGRAAEKLGLSSRLGELREARDQRQGFEADLDTAMQKLVSGLTGDFAGDPLLPEAERQRQAMAALRAEYGIFGDAVVRLVGDARDGGGDLRAFRAEIEALGNGAKNDQGVQALLRSIDGLAAQAYEADANLQKATSAQRVLDGSASDLDYQLLGLTARMREAAGASGQLARTISRTRGPDSYFGDLAAGVAEDNRRFDRMLDLIGQAEGTDRGRGYNETLGYGRFTGGDVDLVSMTLNEVLELQRRMLADPGNTFNSSAVGRYQITAETLKDFMPRLGLDGNMLFSPEVQDRIAMAIINMAGRDVARLQGRWQGLQFVSPGQILGAFDASGGERSSALAAERAGEAERLARQKADADRLSLDIIRLTEEAERRIAEEKKGQLRTQQLMQREQAAFLDQFRGLTDGLAAAIFRAREETGSWTKGWMAGLDMIENKAMSLLDKLIDRLLDEALFGKKGTSGGGLLGGLIGDLGGLLGGLLNPSQNALGNAFIGGRVTGFATGGIVSGPTLFPMRGGTGLMGEAGPEAIMPLTRMGSGHLGVRAQGQGGQGPRITIHNYGAPVRTEERREPDGGISYDIFVGEALNRHIASGAADPVLAQRFGVNPRTESWG